MRSPVFIYFILLRVLILYHVTLYHIPAFKLQVHYWQDYKLIFLQIQSVPWFLTLHSLILIIILGSLEKKCEIEFFWINRIFCTVVCWLDFHICLFNKYVFMSTLYTCSSKFHSEIFTDKKYYQSPILFMSSQ